MQNKANTCKQLVPTSAEMSQGSSRVRQTWLARSDGLTSFASCTDCADVNEEIFQVSPVTPPALSVSAKQLKQRRYPSCQPQRSCSYQTMLYPTRGPRSQVALSLYSSLLTSPTFATVRQAWSGSTLTAAYSRRPVQLKSSHFQRFDLTPGELVLEAHSRKPRA